MWLRVRPKLEDITRRRVHLRQEPGARLLLVMPATKGLTIRAGLTKHKDLPIFFGG